MSEVEEARAPFHGVVDVLLAQHRADRGIAGAQAFADRHDVRLDRQLLICEPASDAAHAGDHLVEADQKPVLLAALMEPEPELVGRRIRRQRRPADGLAEKGGDRLRTGLLQPLVELS